MKKKFYWIILLLVSSTFMFSGCGTKELDPEALKAKEAARMSLFKDADASLKTADSKAGVLFAPDLYNDGMTAYSDAASAFDNDKDLAVIEKKLATAREKFDQASEVSDRSVEFFKDTKAARDDAEKAGAMKIADDKWIGAEKRFRNAIEAYKDGKNEKATTLSREALQLYRDSELNAIKIAHLGEVNKGIAQLQDMGGKNKAPKTLKKAEALALNASSELDRQRYDNENAKKLAAEAEYEVRHANQINEKVKTLKDSDSSYEDLILEQEEGFSKIGNEFGLDLSFDQGFEAPAAGIVGAIQKQKSDLSEKDRQIDAHAATIADLNGRLSTKEQSLANLSRRSEDLKKKMQTAEEMERQKKAEEMERQRKLKEELERQKMTAEELLKEKQLQEERMNKLRTVQTLLNPDEGKVLLDGKNIIVRLTGLTFASGKSAIEPKFFSLLTKTKQIIDSYERSTVTIQGHTDSLGKEKTNLKLSKDRAESVRQYFLANTDITEDRIKAVGFGSSQPVANNTTKEGRAQNRRIDVVIRPGVE